jgi:hypothetical protein
MKYLKKFNETSNALKDDVEVIFKDKNLVCLIPKSQKAAHIYGYKTKWCSISKKRWDELTFLHESIRFFFLFKNGYKLRLSYIPRLKSGDWADSSGNHILHFKDKDPFEIETNSIDKTVIDKILSIPELCKNKIREYIIGNKKINYIKREEDYKPKTVFGKKMYDDKHKYYIFKHDALPGIKSLLSDKDEINVKYDPVRRKFILNYTINGNSKKEEYNDYDSFEKEVMNMLNELIYNI